MSINQKGTIHLLLPVVILVAVTAVLSTNIKTTVKYGSDQVKGVLIAKEGENDNRGSGSSDNGSNNNSGNSDDHRGPSDEVRIKQEIRTNDERIKTEIREDRTRIDIYQGGTKTRIQQRGNDEFLIKTEVEDENEEGEENNVEEASGSADEGEIIKELRAISKFPLRIDLSTNQLIMTKNGTERVLTVLPAHAVQNMLRAHLKKGLGPKFFQDATSSASPSATPLATASAEPTTPSASPTEESTTESTNITVLEEQITLEEDGGQIVYKIPAKKHLRIFGFIPLTTNLTGIVSAETGELLREQQSLLAQILDFLSPSQ